MDMIRNQVFATFPTSADLYSADIAPMVNYVITRYGQAEWRATVLTNELHGHLGIYATIGVKMGIYACEMLNHPHQVRVVSFAGEKPPVSCLNDGLQISTGATVGHGLISVERGASARPEAEFITEEQRLRLRLKSDYAARISDDVNYGVKTYGTKSPRYWAYIRHLAIEYWQTFDRHDIFEVVSA